MIAEVVFQDGATLFELNSKGIEELSIREGGIDISNDHDIASLIEVGDDISNFQLAVDF
jgi:hypothetical protein